jgi:hypothetical protein
MRCKFSVELPRRGWKVGLILLSRNQAKNKIILCELCGLERS